MDEHFVVSKKIAAWLLAFNFTVWLTFTVIYGLIDYRKHFDVPASHDGSWSATAYFALMVQTQMFGTSNTPKTATGRALVAVQGVFAWAQTIIFLAPWIAHRVGGGTGVVMRKR